MGGFGWRRPRFMHIPRIHIQEPLSVGKKIVLNTEISRHLSSVLRVKIGDVVLVFNGTGGEFYSKIFEIAKQHTTIIIEKFNAGNAESSLKIHLLQGISRGEKMDFTIQKAVELGVHAITPLFTEYCNVKLEAERLDNKLRHWQAIAIHAAEQSGRCYVPQILTAQDLKMQMAQASLGLHLVLAPGVENSLGKITEKVDNVVLLVGPEGGFSPEEMTYILKKHFLPVKLGPRILRTETAALVALSVLQAKWGDLV